MIVDLNADLAEGAGTDAELMPLITSANICCGLHAGNPETIRATLILAKQHGVVVGAHPGFNDREYFGRRELALSSRDIADWCTYQIGALIGMCRAVSVEVRYVKPHGALYNLACRDETTAIGVAEAVSIFGLPVVGLPKGTLAAACAGRIPYIAEGFADRRYRPDGSLVPRSDPDPFVHDPVEAVAQVDWLIREQGIRTVCVHGDNPEAVRFARSIREALLAQGFTLQSFA